jgi:hypothetical protein
MRRIWFGDKRDIVKWSTLLLIANQYNLKQILQICFLNQSSFPSVTIDGIEYEVPEEVIKHFRDIRSVERLSSNVTITVFDEPFTVRKCHLSSSLAAIDKYEYPICVFLDPDTGLEPASLRANKTHVTTKELQDYWAKIKQGDVLVFYQHKPLMNKVQWIVAVPLVPMCSDISLSVGGLPCSSR